MKNTKQNQGFTLIEMMVSVTIFTVVAMVVSVAFVNLSLLNKKAQVNRALIDNVNLAMDVMAFKIREGREYELGNLSGGDDELNFVGSYNQDTSFKLGNHYNSNGCIEMQVDGGGFSCLTSSEVDITTLQFKRYYGPDWPREKIGVRVRGTIKYRKTQSDFSLQANISQRNR